MLSNMVGTRVFSKTIVQLHCQSIMEILLFFIALCLVGPSRISSEVTDSTNVGSVKSFSIPHPDPCMKFSLSHIIPDPNEPEKEWRTQLEMEKRNTAIFCKNTLERDIQKSLAELDEGLKDRVNSLVEQMIKENDGRDFELSKGRNRFLMLQKSIEKAILVDLEKRGADLCSIKTRGEFDLEYDKLFADCNEILKNLHRDVYVYVLFLNNNHFHLEPTVAQWARNTMACEILQPQLTDIIKQGLLLQPVDHIRQGAFELLKKTSGTSDEDRLNCFSFLEIFSRKH